MSLWTPDGERPVQTTPPPSTPDDSSAGQGALGIPPELQAELDAMSPEERARAEEVVAEMARARAELLSVPAGTVVANHAMGLYELAAIHLSSEKPDIAQAQIAIDAFGALIDTIGDRLGPDVATLRDALAQIRLAFVQIKAVAEQA